MLLRAALDQCATGLLRHLAVAHGIAAGETATRVELIQRLAERLLEPGYVAVLLARLTPAQRQALGAARAQGGEIRGFLLTRILGDSERTALQPLLDLGLLFRTFAAVGAHRGEVFAVPEDVLALAGPLEGPPASAASAALGEAPEPERPERRATDPSFSLFALASALAREANMERSGRAAALPSALRQEVEAWSQEPGRWPWQDRWTFLQHLGLQAGLLTEHDGEVRPADVLAGQLGERAALHTRLWRAYLRDRAWADLERAGVSRAAELGEQADPVVTRAAVLELLGALPTGQERWVALADLLEWIHAVRPAFLREQLDERSAVLRDPELDAPLLGEGSWPRIEGRLLRYLVLGPLYWLGAVAADARGERVRLTAAGADLLAGREEALRRPVEPCHWEGATMLVASARAELGALLRTERYLTLEQRGALSRYRLDRAHVARQLGAGGSIAELRELLERLTSGAIPEDTARALADWEAQQGALRLQPVVLLEAHTDALLEWVLAEPRTARFVERQVGPTTAVVRAVHAGELAEALREAGHVPRMDAALRLMAGRRAYAALVDEHVLEFLLVSLLAFRELQPEHLAQLAGARDLTAHLEQLFPPHRLVELREAAAQLAHESRAARAEATPRRTRARRPRQRRGQAAGA